MKDFENKVAVITGAASGIGRGIARRAAGYMNRDRLLLFEPSIERYKKNHPETEQYLDLIVNMYEKGTSPDQAGDVVFEAIRNGLFYILTEVGFMWKKPLKTRFNEILKAYEQNKLLLKSL